MFKKAYCPIKNSECTAEPRISTAVTCFIAIPFKEEMVTTTRTITAVLQEYGIKYYLAKEDITAGQDILCKICQNILFSDFGVIEATYSNPNVMIEFGMLLGQRKPVFVLLDKSRMRTSRLPADIVGLERIEYKNQETLSKRFRKGIGGFVQRLDVEEIQLQSLMELTKASASKGDLASVDSLLQTIFERLKVPNGRQDRFVVLLEEIMVEFWHQKDFVTSFRYGLAGVRTYLMQDKIEKARNLFEKMMLQFSDFVSSSRESAANIVQDLSFVSEDLLGFYELWLDKFRLNDFKNPQIVEFFYAHLWYGLQHSSKPESWMKEFQEILDILRLKDPLPWFDICRFPWQGYLHPNFFWILWLYAVTQTYDENKKALEMAQETLEDIRDSVNVVALNTLQGFDPYDWYDEYLRPARDFEKLLKEL